MHNCELQIPNCGRFMNRPYDGYGDGGRQVAAPTIFEVRYSAAKGGRMWASAPTIFGGRWLESVGIGVLDGPWQRRLGKS